MSHLNGLMSSFVAGACLLMAGCGNTVIVEGQLLKNGTPLTETRDVSYEMFFAPLESSGEGPSQSFPANVNDDGTFIVKGFDRKGIPRGRYEVFVNGKRNRKGAVDAEPPVRFKTKVEVTGSNLEIDVAKPSE